MKFNIITSHSKNMVIGQNNQIPWTIPNDLKYFKNITSKTHCNPNIVLMGYNTWVSIPSNYKPLSNRINVVITNNHYDTIISPSKDKSCFFKVKSFTDFEYLCENNLKNKYNKILYSFVVLKPFKKLV